MLKDNIIVDKNGCTKVKSAPRNNKRNIIIEENLISYISDIKLSERNKSIVTDYTFGQTTTMLAKQHGISRQAICEIISNFIRLTHKYIQENDI